MNDELLAEHIKAMNTLTASIGELVNAVALLIDSSTEQEQEDQDVTEQGVYLLDGTRIS